MSFTPFFDEIERLSDSYWVAIAARSSPDKEIELN